MTWLLIIAGLVVSLAVLFLLWCALLWLVNIALDASERDHWRDRLDD